VGIQEAMMHAIPASRRGGTSAMWAWPGVALPGLELFFSHVHLHGHPAPVRDYLPELIDLILSGKISPGKVFDPELPPEEAAEGYKAMDVRCAIKVLLRP
jgi:threonine dehydrogenase-like Zn-dependent dehydrogenase